jgi:L,D-transpeptidase-like protein
VTGTNDRCQVRIQRRQFLGGAGAIAAVAMLPMNVRVAGAEPIGDQEWVANHVATRLLGSDGGGVAWLVQWTHMRVLHEQRGLLHVWVPRIHLTGYVQAQMVGPVAAPSQEQLVSEEADASQPPILGAVGLPGCVVGGGNLRSWPVVRGDTLLRTLGHNAQVRAISRVQGDQGDEWYSADWLDPQAQMRTGTGFLHHSVLRLPRLRTPADADRNGHGRWLEADLMEPTMLTAFENGAPIWATLAIKGTAVNRTPQGEYHIVTQVLNETMDSETLHPPIPRNGPGGYYLKNVLWTQYYKWTGETIHYNYWSSNWGYAGSHGCLGLGYYEAKWAWNFADIGTPVRIWG